MPVPNAYTSVSNPPRILQLSMQDLFKGTPYAIVYPTSWKEGSTGSNVQKYALIASALQAGDIATAFDGNAGTAVNFDTTIKDPLIIEGDLLTNFTTARDATGTGQWSVMLQKVAKGVTTNLGSASGALVAANDEKRQFVSFAVARDSFAFGDILRLRVEGTGTNGGNSTLYHDPNSTTTVGTDAETNAAARTDFVVQLPIKLIS